MMQQDQTTPRKWEYDMVARQRIVAAARRHFFAHGFRNVTMSDLAAELGMSKKTLYAHFSSKTALLDAMLQQKAAHIDSDLERITSACARDVSQAVHELLACLQHHLEEIRPPFLRDLQREAPELFDLVDERRRRIIRHHFGKLFGEGRRSGTIRKDVPVSVVIEILLAATHAIMNPPKMKELGLSPRSGFTAIIGVVLKGVLTDAGRANL
jgi:AcrR family transcriptional regulator